MIHVTEPIDRFLTALESGKVKGETEFLLYDVRTNKTEVYRDSNMITGAIGKIFKSNYGGLMNLNSCLPVRSMLGGIMLFNAALTESTENVFPPCRSSNRLVGHAGQTAHSSASSTRGNPNAAASWVHADDGQVRFAWDFALEQANDGPINSCALTHHEAGDAGLYPDGTLPLIKTVGQVISGVNRCTWDAIGGSTWNRARALTLPMSIESNGYGLSVWINGTTFEEIKVRHPFVKAELIEGPTMYGSDNFSEVSSRTATLSRTFTSGYTMIGQDASNYYVMERDSADNTKLYLDIVDKSDMSVTSSTITIAGATLARPQLTMSQMFNGIISDGNIYWISGANAKTFVRINIATPADVEILTTNMTNDISQDLMPISKTAGLIMGHNYLINDDTVYPVAVRNLLSDERYGFSIAANYDNSPLFYQNVSLNNSSSYYQISAGGLLYLPYLASVNNLNNPVDKNANKTMRVQYTLSITG